MGLVQLGLECLWIGRLKTLLSLILCFEILVVEVSVHEVLVVHPALDHMRVGLMEVT